MSTTSIDEYPYTIGYVSQLLETTEDQVMQICKQRAVPTHTDEATGRVFFSLKSLEQLRQYMENQKRGDLAAPSTQLAKAPAPANKPTFSSSSPAATLPEKPMSTRSKPQFADVSDDNLSRTDISHIVDSVSNAKESILQDLSMLLDDRLSGLDELVVELIRSKRENDRLKKELKKLEDSVATFQNELDKYKPAAFGFFRKVQ